MIWIRKWEMRKSTHPNRFVSLPQFSARLLQDSRSNTDMHPRAQPKSPVSCEDETKLPHALYICKYRITKVTLFKINMQRGSQCHSGNVYTGRSSQPRPRSGLLSQQTTRSGTKFPLNTFVRLWLKLNRLFNQLGP